jgi:hypothetical protein
MWNGNWSTLVAMRVTEVITYSKDKLSGTTHSSYFKIWRGAVSTSLELSQSGVVQKIPGFTKQRYRFYVRMYGYIQITMCSQSSTLR